LEEKTKLRNTLYGLISRLLMSEIDSEILKILKYDSQVLELFPNLKEWELFQNLDDDKLINEHLNVDFTNISLLHLTPYETFYTREDGLIETGGANPVTDFYHKYGFKVEFEKARVLSPDHIGVELEFMFKLTEAELTALKENDTKTINLLRAEQREFLKKHVINWFALYLISMKYESRTPLYHDLAELTISFVLEDYEYLES
jgi:TorA maturation chaperone TorD